MAGLWLPETCHEPRAAAAACGPFRLLGAVSLLAFLGVVALAGALQVVGAIKAGMGLAAGVSGWSPGPVAR